MTEYQITPEQMTAIRLKEINYEKRRIEGYSCYNRELDLWNTTKLAELNREYRLREDLSRG